jgi:hypothetical protein
MRASTTAISALSALRTADAPAIPHRLGGDRGRVAFAADGKQPEARAAALGHSTGRIRPRAKRQEGRGGLCGCAPRLTRTAARDYIRP